MGADGNHDSSDESEDLDDLNEDPTGVIRGVSRVCVSDSVCQ